ncbi:hypothetical protein Q5530_36285, partial [Saccharothrix sp. BKS2]|uniref:hypothetical protein n=1 Tax=Saccharothrix sp. BKS2 TaxID=3064400 RepID=UPI0039E736E4
RPQLSRPQLSRPQLSRPQLSRPQLSPPQNTPPAAPRPVFRYLRHRALLPAAVAVLAAFLLAVLAASAPDAPGTSTDADGHPTGPLTSQVSADPTTPSDEPVTGDPVDAVVDNPVVPTVAPPRPDGEPPRDRPSVTTSSTTGPTSPSRPPTTTTTVEVPPSSQPPSSGVGCEPPSGACADPVG